MPRKATIRKTKKRVARPLRSRRRVFSPARQYGEGELVVFQGSDNGKDTRGFYERYVSPVMSYVSPKISAAYRYAKEGLYATGRGIKKGTYATGRGLKKTGAAVGKGTKWTYKRVLVPTAEFTGRVSPSVGRFARDYILSPTYHGIKQASPVIGRFARDYILSPTYEGAKRFIPAAGRAAYKYVATPLGRAAAKQARRFHEYMMYDEPDDVEYAPAPSRQKTLGMTDPDQYYCTAPYNRRSATIKDRVKSCAMGGKAAQGFAGQKWANKQQCVESCYY